MHPSDRWGQPISRRAILQSTACGFGHLAAQALTATPRAWGAEQPRRDPHHRPRAQRIIFLFMQGGVSQVDSFDYKPLLAREDGALHRFTDARAVANTGKTDSSQRVMRSPWRFRQYGQSGRWVSELFPETAKHVDRLCFIHSLHTEGVAHGPATLFLHCGATNVVRPSMGSWVVQGLGSEADALPGFITISPSLGNGGPRNYGNAFLPARCQGTPIGQADQPDQLTIHDLQSPVSAKSPHEVRRLLQAINGAQHAAKGGADPIDQGIIDSFALAERMETAAPGVLDLEQEAAYTHALYGLDDPATRSFGRKCLLARRLCEAGVRFIQVNYGDNTANPAWDQHSDLPKHAHHARAVDRPIAGLLADLEQRGLLEDTIIWWGGEFGRTPYAEKNGTGRDHNPGGFTVWLAGGGAPPGVAYGATDEWGHLAIDRKVHMHDLHATLLDWLGIDHTRLTWHHAGRDYRLTDVHGRVVKLA